ncbi:MAG TPA: hypothetical protein VGL56_06355 [Fimbriimonadaceae bacterium]|jgi:hypothetical protein
MFKKFWKSSNTDFRQDETRTFNDRLADIREDKAAAKLLKISKEESLCDGCHDPIYEPHNQLEYSLSFVNALLTHATPAACYLIIRGLNDSARFIPIERLRSDLRPVKTSLSRSLPTPKTIPEPFLTELNESYEAAMKQDKQIREKARALDAYLAPKATWPALLRFAGPTDAIKHLKRAGVRLQITHGFDEYRAAALTRVGTFDVRGESAEEALVKALILVQLAVAQPMFDFPPQC